MRFEGLQLDHYRLGRWLGEGGMGEVYCATDLNVPRPVALKMIRIDRHLTAESREEAIHLFRREVAAIARLNHLHIVPLYESGETTIQRVRLPYMVMPLYEESLKTWLSNRSDSLPLDHVSLLTLQAAGALQCAHNHRIIHRDVKPENFFLRSREGITVPDILLGDFGIAAFMDGTTSTGQVIRGTALYMAPERWNGQTCYATDQYALAIMVYELLTRQTPFQGNRDQLMHQHLDVQPQPPSAVNPGLSQPVDTVILKALSKKPADRYASVLAFAEALQAACERPQLGSQPTPPSSPGTGSGPRKFIKRFGVRAGVLLLFVLCIVLIFSLILPRLSGGPKVTSTPGPHTWACSKQPICAHSEQDGELIGMSDGRFAFDTHRSDGRSKQQQNWSRALAMDENDAEALIYQNNALVTGPYLITLVAVTMLTLRPGSGGSASLSAGRAVLQGIYTALHEANESCLLRTAPCWRVRILIANAGDTSGYAADIADQIYTEATSDPTFAGVVGFPFSFPEAIQAIRTLEDDHIPVISPTASSDDQELVHIPQYFFRVNPDDSVQGQAAVQFAIRTFQPHKVAVFEDLCIPYSQTLAGAFTRSLSSLLPQTSIVPIHYRSAYDTSGCDQNAPSLNTLVHSASDSGAGLWFFSGYTTDLETMLSNALVASRLAKHAPVILGGDALYVLGTLGSHYREIYFTAFAYPDEWTFLKRSRDALPQMFFSNFEKNFDPLGDHKGQYDYERPQANAMLGYDATKALFQALIQVLSQQVHPGDPQFMDHLQKALLQVNFQGLSGQIHFAPTTGNAVNKTVVILCADARGNTQIVGLINQFFPGEGQSLYIDPHARNICEGQV